MRKELIEKRNDLIARADEIVDSAKAEKRELTEAEAEELAEIRDNVRKIVTSLGLEDDIEELKMDESRECGDKERQQEQKVDVEEMERRQFENYLRGRVIHERTGELSPSTPPATQTS